MSDYSQPPNLFAHTQSQQQYGQQAYQQQQQQQQAHSYAAQPSPFPSGAPLPSVVVNPPPPQPVKEPFAIKVMRLPSPSFVPLNPLAWKLDSCSTGENGTLPTGAPGCELALSPQLLLPSSLLQVYLGESFRACVSVWAASLPSPASTNATGGNTFHQVGIKLELQTSSRRWTLADSTAAASNFSMAGGSSKALLVSHNLSELGVNCLVALVSYKDEYTGERRSFQKFFKFHVHDPFTIHTTVHARGEGALLAEVQLTSLLNRAVQLWNVHFESAQPGLIQVQDLNGTAAEDGAEGSSALADYSSDEEEEHDETDAVSAAIEGDIAGAGAETRRRSASVTSGPAGAPVPTGRGVLLPGQSSRSFLFRLVELKAASRHVLDLGRLQLRWRSLIGENGRLKSSNVSRTSKPLSRELDLNVTEAPARVAVEQPFVVAAQARNGSASPALLVVQLLKDRMGTLLPLGPAVRQLGVVPPHSSQAFSFQLVGVGVGVQRISGLRVSLTPLLPGGSNLPNTAATVISDFDHLHSIEVCQREDMQDAESDAFAGNALAEAQAI